MWRVVGSFISYRTGHYKLHYYETPTNLKFVMVTDTKTNNLRIVLHQIYVGLYVEYGMLFLLLLGTWSGVRVLGRRRRMEMCIDMCNVSGQEPAITGGASGRCGSQLRNV